MLPVHMLLLLPPPPQQQREKDRRFLFAGRKPLCLQVSDCQTKIERATPTRAHLPLAHHTPTRSSCDNFGRPGLSPHHAEQHAASFRTARPGAETLPPVRGPRGLKLSGPALGVSPLGGGGGPRSGWWTRLERRLWRLTARAGRGAGAGRCAPPTCHDITFPGAKEQPPRCRNSSKTKEPAHCARLRQNCAPSLAALARCRAAGVPRPPRGRPSRPGVRAQGNPAPAPSNGGPAPSGAPGREAGAGAGRAACTSPDALAHTTAVGGGAVRKGRGRGRGRERGWERGRARAWVPPLVAVRSPLAALPVRERFAGPGGTYAPTHPGCGQCWQAAAPAPPCGRGGLGSARTRGVCGCPAPGASATDPRCPRQPGSSQHLAERSGPDRTRGEMGGGSAEWPPRLSTALGDARWRRAPTPWCLPCPCRDRQPFCRGQQLPRGRGCVALWQPGADQFQL